MRYVFIVNLNNREAQNELCRSTKTPEEVYKIALSFERGDKYAKFYVSTTSGGGILSNREVASRSIRNRSELSEGDIETHVNEENDRIRDAGLQEEEDLKDRV